MRIIELYQDYGVSFATEGHKHCRPGWVNVECPFCTGNPGLHLGYNLQDNYFYCWRCGWHAALPTIVELTGKTFREAVHVFKEYGGEEVSLPVPSQPDKTKAYERPSNIISLTAAHSRYLESRGFNPEKLSREWNLQSTGPVSLLDHINYSHRLFIPVMWNNREVSFTTRDTTGLTDLRYISCPKSREEVNHKEILYGLQENWRSTGICAEGPTDVWRLGPFAFGTFGIEFTPRQVRMMAKVFKRIFILYDNDPQAIIQADKLARELQFRRVEAIALHLSTAQDPGSMSQEDADMIVRDLVRVIL